MDIEELKAMIPSETVRRYVLDTGWTFTDMQKAALLYHSSLPLEQRYSWLRALRAKTKDEVLQGQITEYLNYKEQGLQAFEEDDYFTYIFYEVPNPFERGDIVKLVRTEDYGIVETTQKSWKDNLIRWKSPEWWQESRFHYVDWSDVQIRVVFPGEDGTFSHAHINPVDLELYRPQKSRAEQSPLDQLLLCASDLYKGGSSFDELYYFTAEYRKSKRELS